MELKSVMNSTAARLVRDVEQPFVYSPDVARAIQERYRFVEFPQRVEQFATTAPLEFQYGRFFEEAVIGKLVVFRDGIIAQAFVATEKLDLLVDDVLDFLKAEFGVTTEGATILKLYGSSLECEMRSGFATLFQVIEPITRAVRASIEASGIPVSEYQIGGFTVVGEGPADLKPARFVFERRADHPLSANMFFSEAPLSTDKHVALLTELEKLF